METKLIRLPEVKNRTGLSRASIYLFISKGTFPKQYRLGERSVAWIEKEIQDWINSKIET